MFILSDARTKHDTDLIDVNIKSQIDIKSSIGY